MTGELGSPLTIILATGVVGYLLYKAAAKLILDPRRDDHMDDVATHGQP
jgi:hypothetical protein